MNMKRASSYKFIALQKSAIIVIIIIILFLTQKGMKPRSI